MERVKRVLLDKTQNGYLQFFRYGFVAVVSLGFDVGGLVILKEYGHLNYLLAASISFMTGLAVNYVLSAFWVFHSSKLESKMHELVLFLVIGLIGLGMTDLLLWVFTAGLGLYYVLSKAITTIIVYFWNFAARKLFIFR